MTRLGAILLATVIPVVAIAESLEAEWAAAGDAPPATTAAPPTSAAPAEAPPAPPAAPQPPQPQAAQPQAAQPQAAQQTPAGQWVYTQQYGWVWMPYGDGYSYVPPDGIGEPYQYVYYPVYGWTWIVAPWVWGFGPWPYFAIGPTYFGWYQYGYWRTPWRWRYTAVPFRGNAGPYPVRPAPSTRGSVARPAPAWSGAVRGGAPASGAVRGGAPTGGQAAGGGRTRGTRR